MRKAIRCNFSAAEETPLVCLEHGRQDNEVALSVLVTDRDSAAHTCSHVNHTVKSYIVRLCQLQQRRQENHKSTSLLRWPKITDELSIKAKSAAC